MYNSSIGICNARNVSTQAASEAGEDRATNHRYLFSQFHYRQYITRDQLIRVHIYAHGYSAGLQLSSLRLVDLQFILYLKLISKACSLVNVKFRFYSVVFRLRYNCRVLYAYCHYDNCKWFFILFSCRPTNTHVLVSRCMRWCAPAVVNGYSCRLSTAPYSLYP